MIGAGKHLGPQLGRAKKTTGENVARQRSGPEDFSQRPECHTPIYLGLPQPVLGNGIAKSEEQPPRVSGEHVGHAVIVSNDSNSLGLTGL